MPSRVIIGYWDKRGRGEPIRQLLTYAGVNFEDKRYEKSAWRDVKFTLGFDFPMIPYLIDDNFKLTQTMAILRYLARKYKLDGTTETEKHRIDLLENQISDNIISYRKDATEENKAEFLKELTTQLQLLSKFLGTNKYAVGSNMTYVDFLLYEYLHYIEHSEVAKGWVSKFENLTSYVKRYEALPQLKGYLAKLNTKYRKHFLKQKDCIDFALI